MAGAARNSGHREVLYVIACGSPLARHVGRLVDRAQQDGWDVCVVTTPDGAKFVDQSALIRQTGHPVRTHYKNPGDPDGAPAQIVNCGWPTARAQVAPPSVDTKLVSPLAPPSFQRSCWNIATRWLGLVGSPVTCGSTSASG